MRFIEPRSVLRLVALAAVVLLTGRRGEPRLDDTAMAVRDPAARPTGTGQKTPSPGRLPVIAAIGIAVLLASVGLAFWQATDRRQRIAVVLTHGNPARAPALMRRYGCGGCHTIPDIPGADGKVAPPLAGLRERVFVGGAVANSADNLIRWIVSPQAFSPRSAMPASGITEAEARDVAAFLYAH
jgi:cytochrome c1